MTGLHGIHVCRGRETYLCILFFRFIHYIVRVYCSNSSRFDDTTTRATRRTLDQAALMRDILETFRQNCLSSYSVGENLVIEEMMEGFRGKCPFK